MNWPVSIRKSWSAQYFTGIDFTRRDSRLREMLCLSSAPALTQKVGAPKRDAPCILILNCSSMEIPLVGPADYLDTNGLPPTK